MTILEAAIQVLKEGAEPLHVNEITRRILSRRLWKTSGKTPSATVGAKLYSDIREKGETSPFILHASQTFDLRDKKSSGEVTAHRMKVRDAAIAVLKEAGKPLHVREITRLILSKGLWKTSGKTPDATVGSRLYSDRSVFTLPKPKTFGLVEWESSSKAVANTHPQATLAKTYSFIESALKVLEKFGGKSPMHYKEITEKAIKEGWLIADDNKTPEASMYSQILREIERCNRRGEQPRFVKHGKGFVGLSRWMAKGLVFEIENHNKKVRKELHKHLLDMEWDDFESLIARLLGEMGFEGIEVTDKVKDGGIDVRGTLIVGYVIRTQMAVQVKRWKANVQTPTVQQVRGSLGPHEQGLIITTGGFTKGARENAAKPEFKPVALMNGEQLVTLLVENGIGIDRQSHDLIELYDDDDPFRNG